MWNKKGWPLYSQSRENEAPGENQFPRFGQSEIKIIRDDSSAGARKKINLQFGQFSTKIIRGHSNVIRFALFGFAKGYSLRVIRLFENDRINH